MSGRKPHKTSHLPAAKTYENLSFPGGQKGDISGNWPKW
jgi:hypothetical protein